MAEVVHLGAHDRMTVADCVGVVSREAPAWKDILVLGYDEDGELVVRSSHLERKEAVWLLLEALDWARGKANG